MQISDEDYRKYEIFMEALNKVIERAKKNGGRIHHPTYHKKYNKKYYNRKQTGKDEPA